MAARVLFAYEREGGACSRGCSGEIDGFVLLLMLHVLLDMKDMLMLFTHG